MSIAKAEKAIVKKHGRNWGVYVNGYLVEGGFFSKDEAIAQADVMNDATDAAQDRQNDYDTMRHEQGYSDQ